MVTKKQAALRHINAAILHFHAREYECAITLIGAAEDLIGNVNSVHLWEVLKNERPDGHSEKEWATILNATRDWLKHATAQLGDEREITQFEAMIIIFRAVYKFFARYNEVTRDMEHFYEWCHREGYTAPNSARRPGRAA
jgi:hypothetical protein